MPLYYGGKFKVKENGMSTNTIKRIKFIYAIVLSVLLVVAGVLLMISCVSIYQIGDRPFTTENIANAFGKIQIPIYITLGAVLAGIALWLYYPNEKGKNKAAVPEKVQLERMESKLNVENCNPDLLYAISSEKKLRRLLRWIVAALCTLCMLPALIYALDFSHYAFPEYNASIIAATLWVLPCSAMAAAFVITLSYADHFSVQREMKLVKTAIAAYGAVKSAPAVQKVAVTTPTKRDKIVLAIRIAVAVIGVAFVVVGIVNGGMADVLAKAINICTECIGLG